MVIHQAAQPASIGFSHVPYRDDAQLTPNHLWDMKGLCWHWLAALQELTVYCRPLQDTRRPL